MRRFAMVVAALCCLLGSGTAAALPPLLSASASANPADLDTSFGKGGIIDLAQPLAEQFPSLHAYAIDIAVGPDEAVYVLSRGAECETGGKCRSPLIVTRYAANGSPDLAYGDRGSTVLTVGGFYGGKVASIAVDSQGRALVAAEKGDSICVARLGADGNRDRSFGEDGEVIASSWRYALTEIAVSAADEVTVESDWFIQHPGHRPGGERATAAVSITRFRADGSRDPAFGDAGTVKASFRRSSPPRAMAVRPGGGILLAGQTCCSPHDVPYLARVLADGRVDARFGHLPSLRRLRSSRAVGVNALLLRAGGKIDLAGAVSWGRYTGRTGGFVLRLRRDGTPERRFGRGGMRLPEPSVEAAALDPQGRTFVVSSKSEAEMRLFRLTLGGAIDRSFGGRDGRPAEEVAGGDGILIAAYAGPHPLVFNQRFYACRSACPPSPVLARFVGGPGGRHRGG